MSTVGLMQSTLLREACAVQVDALANATAATRTTSFGLRLADQLVALPQRLSTTPAATLSQSESGCMLLAYRGGDTPSLQTAADHEKPNHCWLTNVLPAPCSWPRCSPARHRCLPACRPGNHLMARCDKQEQPDVCHHPQHDRAADSAGPRGRARPDRPVPAGFDCHRPRRQHSLHRAGRQRHICRLLHVSVQCSGPSAAWPGCLHHCQREGPSVAPAQPHAARWHCRLPECWVTASLSGGLAKLSMSPCWLLLPCLPTCSCSAREKLRDINPPADALPCAPPCSLFVQNGANQCAYAVIRDKDAPQGSPRLAFPPTPAFTPGSYGGSYGPTYSPPSYGSPAVMQPPMKSAALPPAPTLFGAAPVQLPAAYGLPAAQPPFPAVRWAWLHAFLRLLPMGEGMQTLVRGTLALHSSASPPDAFVGSSNGSWRSRHTRHHQSAHCVGVDQSISKPCTHSVLCSLGSLDQK